MPMKKTSLGCRLAGERRRWAALIVIFLLIAGCGDEKAKQLKAALSESRRANASLKMEKSRLEEQISNLQDALEELSSAYGNLEVKDRQLAHWSRQVAERFGPGVWYFSRYEKPLPCESIPEATPEVLVARLNGRFRKSKLPQVILVAIEGKTARVRISDDRQLTQQMGSAGATGYIQAVTYTLTSLPAIAFVDFDFQEGDHAVPGRYSR